MGLAVNKFILMKEASLGLNHSTYCTYRTFKPGEHVRIELMEGKLFIYSGKLKVPLVYTQDLEKEGTFKRIQEVNPRPDLMD
jgi:hypothetical protein